jgi:hypothetical protein
VLQTLQEYLSLIRFSATIVRVVLIDDVIFGPSVFVMSAGLHCVLCS